MIVSVILPLVVSILPAIVCLFCVGFGRFVFVCLKFSLLAGTDSYCLDITFLGLVADPSAPSYGLLYLCSSSNVEHTMVSSRGV